MSPILGIWASKLKASNYTSIATATITSTGTTTFTFSSIPSTYTHLQIRYITRGDGSGSWTQNVIMSVNSDTTATNYYNHHLIGNGTSASTQTGNSNDWFMVSTVASSLANTYAVGVMDILDYANTNKYKTFRTLQGADLNGSGSLYFSSGLWKNTAAINSITITNVTTFGGNFVAPAQFALYGIK